MRNKGYKSKSRVEQRELEKKLVPAIKLLSTHLHNTGELPSKFVGYNTVAGTIRDKVGREWQLQVRGVVLKSEFMKKNEIKPMFKGFMLWLKIKSIAKHIITWSEK